MQRALAQTLRRFCTAEGTVPRLSYIPRRAVLYIPASDRRKLLKSHDLRPDALVLDCEDGVALGSKAEARHNVMQQLHFGKATYAGVDLGVRVNAVSSGMCLEDLKSVLDAEHLPQTLYLPKVESPEELEWLYSEVASLLKGRESSSSMRLVLFCESGAALLNFTNICDKAKQLSAAPNAPLLVDGAVFGSDDFCADLSITRSAGATELLFARQHFLVSVKSRRLQAIDAVYIDYKDQEGLERQSLEGAAFGFTGKQIIHPGQIATVQRCFSPSPERVEWAEGLVAAFEVHTHSGKGAFTYRDSMIDMPLVLQAKNILRTIEHSKQEDLPLEEE